MRKVDVRPYSTFFGDNTVDGVKGEGSGSALFVEPDAEGRRCG